MTESESKMNQKMVYCSKSDGLAQELQVQDLVCKQCRHIVRMEPFTIQKILAETMAQGVYKCPLCYYPKGVHKIVRTYEQCGTCHQVMDPKDLTCLCIWKDNQKPGIRFVIDPKNVWRKDPKTITRDREVEEGKINSLMRKKQRQIIKEDIERKQKDSKNLEIIATKMLLDEERRNLNDV